MGTPHAFRRLSVLRRSIDITDQCEAFPYFILNNTSDPANAIEEEALAEALLRKPVPAA